MRRRKNERGFTLMELMVVIVIVAILAAVAVPLYINYVKDAQRTEAKGAIGAIIAAEQVYFQKPENGAYAITGDPGTLLGIDLTESKVNWAFALDANGDATDGFKVTATGLADRPSKGLIVTYTHSRSTPPPNPWTEQ